MAVSRSFVSHDQFDISDEGITHKPMGYSLKPYPDDPTKVNIFQGMLGSKLPSGEDYRRDDVEEMARRLWLAYLKQTGKIS
jgi:hypothetical protein